MPRPEFYPPRTTTQSRSFSQWRMNRILKFNGLFAASFGVILSLCLAFHPLPCHADMDAEINHLLKYIEDSGCTFNRNGTNHDSRDASEHIRRKYVHVKRRIRSTEDFIRYAATESSMSGRPYTVICEGVEKPTAEWLADELARFRNNLQ